MFHPLSFSLWLCLFWMSLVLAILLLPKNILGPILPLLPMETLIFSIPTLTPTFLIGDFICIFFWRLLRKALLIFLPPLLIPFGLWQGIFSGKQFISDPSSHSFFSGRHSCKGNNGAGQGDELGAEGNGIKEFRLGAGAMGTCRAVAQIENLPVLFGSNGCCPSMRGMFSFSMESLYLAWPSEAGRIDGGL